MSNILANAWESYEAKKQARLISYYRFEVTITLISGLSNVIARLR